MSSHLAFSKRENRKQKAPRESKSKWRNKRALWFRCALRPKYTFVRFFAAKKNQVRLLKLVTDLRCPNFKMWQAMNFDQSQQFGYCEAHLSCSGRGHGLQTTSKKQSKRQLRGNSRVFLGDYNANERKLTPYTTYANERKLAPYTTYAASSRHLDSWPIS